MKSRLRLSNKSKMKVQEMLQNRHGTDRMSFLQRITNSTQLENTSGSKDLQGGQGSLTVKNLKGNKNLSQLRDHSHSHLHGSKIGDGISLPQMSA